MHIKYVPLARVSVKARHLKQAGGDIFIKERIMSHRVQADGHHLLLIVFPIRVVT